MERLTERLTYCEGCRTSNRHDVRRFSVTLNLLGTHTLNTHADYCPDCAALARAKRFGGGLRIAPMENA